MTARKPLQPMRELQWLAREAKKHIETSEGPARASAMETYRKILAQISVVEAKQVTVDTEAEAVSGKLAALSTQTRS